jgi:hypothetical protein
MAGIRLSLSRWTLIGFLFSFDCAQPFNPVALAADQADTAKDAKSVKSLEQRVSEIEKRVDALESIPPIAMALKLKSDLNAQAAAVAAPTPQKDAPLVLIDASLTFSDRLGNKLITIRPPRQHCSVNPGQCRRKRRDQVPGVFRSPDPEPQYPRSLCPRL